MFQHYRWRKGRMDNNHHCHRRGHHHRRRRRRGGDSPYDDPLLSGGGCCCCCCYPCFLVSSLSNGIKRCVFAACYPILRCFGWDSCRHHHHHLSHLRWSSLSLLFLFFIFKLLFAILSRLVNCNPNLSRKSMAICVYVKLEEMVWDLIQLLNRSNLEYKFHFWFFILQFQLLFKCLIRTPVNIQIHHFLFYYHYFFIIWSQELATSATMRRYLTKKNLIYLFIYIIIGWYL